MHITSTFLSGIFALASLWSSVQGASLQRVTDYNGTNPTNVELYIYVPDKLAPKPPVILAMHPCGGNAQGYYGMTKLPTYANDKGFIIMYPQTKAFSNCWDCHNAKTLIRDGGGDSTGLSNMVKWVLAKYNGDPTKVFSTGSSSGAMMTSVMASAYPDMFNAAACFSGVPAGCWKGSPQATPFSSDLSCPNGQKTFTATQWGDLARAGYPDYKGNRTRMQIWHGTTDNLVNIKNLNDQLAQWSNVLNLTFSKNVTNTPQSGYTELVYGDGTQLQGYNAQGVGHMVPYHEKEVLEFFGI